MEQELKPWGHYEVVHTDENCKVKILTIKPGQQTSVHYHVHRQEALTVVSGTGAVYLEDGVYDVRHGKQVCIPYHALHRLSNTSKEHNLVIIETQIGTSFEEADITRILDDYGRIETADSSVDFNSNTV